MGWRVCGLWTTVALIALASILAGSGTALAAAPGKPFTRTATADLTAAFGVPAVATARCPRGSRAVAGGWSMNSLSSAVEVDESRRVGIRGWRVSVVRAGTPAAAELTTYAYCDRAAPPASVRRVKLEYGSVA